MRVSCHFPPISSKDQANDSINSQATIRCYCYHCKRNSSAPVKQSSNAVASPGSSTNGPSPPEVTQGPTGPSTGSGGNNNGITISDFTTIPSAPSLGNLPKSGQAAISALKPAANSFLDGLNDAGCLISGLFGALFGGGGCDGGGGGGLTSGAVSTAAASLTDLIEGELRSCSRIGDVADTWQVEKDY